MKERKRKPNVYEDFGGYLKVYTSGKRWFFIDSSDVWIINLARWVHDTQGYVVGRVRDFEKAKMLKLHRVLIQPSAFDIIDHISGDVTDNRRANIRVCSRSQNSMNRKRPNNNTSGFKGVVYKKKVRTWEANIMANGKKVYLGRFKTPEEAYKAYCNGASAFHGEFARLA